jgi:hypothetical protein
MADTVADQMVKEATLKEFVQTQEPGHRTAPTSPEAQEDREAGFFNGAVVPCLDWTY